MPFYIAKIDFGIITLVLFMRSEKFINFLLAFINKNATIFIYTLNCVFSFSLSLS